LNSMTKPNIIFILIDDLGWRDLGCYGSKFYETPNLDRLAEEGMRFTDAYAAAPVCSPTRASILSGKYPATLGLTNYIGGKEHPSFGKLIDAPYIDHLPMTERSLAKTLNEAGYATWFVGKWHLGARPYYPMEHGFEVNIGGCSWGHPRQGYFSPYGIETLENGPRGEYLTDRLTNEAIELIKNKDERPFFLYLSHYAVHTPIQAKEDDLARFKEKAVKMGLDKVDPLREGEHFPVEHKKGKRVTRRMTQSDPAYAAMIFNLDQNIGRLLEAIEDIDHTIVIFTSDNGGLSTAEGSPTCNSPLSEGKGWMYDGGVREPLIIKWPGVIQSGSVCEVAVTSPDFYPTLLELAGLSLLPEQHYDGISIAPLLYGEESIDREAIYWHYPHYGNQGGTPGSAIRRGDHKLIEFFEDGRLELYNLREDISETKNLVTAEPQLAAEMHRMLVSWRNSIEALMPQPRKDQA